MEHDSINPHHLFAMILAQAEAPGDFPDIMEDDAEGGVHSHFTVT